MFQSVNIEERAFVYLLIVFLVSASAVSVDVDNRIETLKQ
jgi:hypothetical protein